jgi:hypothetical protein
VSDRDFVSEALYILATIGVHLSRIGEESILSKSDKIDSSFAFPMHVNVHMLQTFFSPNSRNKI